MSHFRDVFVLTILTIAGPAAPASAQVGELDPTFGTGGVVVARFVGDGLALFNDGFESGDTTAWSTAVP